MFLASGYVRLETYGMLYKVQDISELSRITAIIKEWYKQRILAFVKVNYI